VIASISDHGQVTPFNFSSLIMPLAMTRLLRGQSTAPTGLSPSQRIFEPVSRLIMKIMAKEAPK